MASKQQAKLAKKLAKRNVALAKKKRETDEDSGVDPQAVEQERVKRPKGKGTEVYGVGLPASNMTEVEVRKHLAVQGKALFQGKSVEEMSDFLNVASDWGMQFVMMAQYSVGATRDLAAFLPKKTELERKKVEDTSKMAAEEAEAAKLAQTEVNTLQERVKELELEVEKEKDENETMEKIWIDAFEVYFHAAIKQMKYLNPGVDLNTRGSGSVVIPLVTWSAIPGTRYLRLLPCMMMAVIKKKWIILKLMGWQMEGKELQKKLTPTPKIRSNLKWSRDCAQNAQGISPRWSRDCAQNAQGTSPRWSSDCTRNAQGTSLRWSRDCARNAQGRSPRWSRDCARNAQGTSPRWSRTYKRISM
ncbi:hypothetical protein SESBI_03070 [Sesbania bispinosa]|nr:hypothetical protein SESBI_03070 [Sesbania bispinosa]